jgi:MoaA/NifB/PqqE/SkfB family radical SAM enzyme
MWYVMKQQTIMEHQIKDVKDGYVSGELTKQMLENREKLRQTRPYVYEKLMNYLKLGNVPENPVCARIDWAIGYECNFKCQHCFAKAFTGRTENRAMTIDQIKTVAQQADDLGVFMINLIGGEPLIGFDLDEVIRVLDPKRFRISVTTNGWKLTKQMAKHLAEIGVDRVCISVDSANPEEHDSFRGVKGSHARAMAAIRNSLDAGMVTQIATVVTHQNLHSDGITRLFEITNEMGVYMDLPVAAPCGAWLGKLDMLIDEDDAQYIRDLRKNYPLVRRDIFPSPGLQGGCFAVKQTLYVIPTGDVLPCLLIHSSLGNVFETPLREIRERGLQLEPFKKYSAKCFAGEDREFIDKYMSRTFTGKELPLSFEEGFL